MHLETLSSYGLLWSSHSTGPPTHTEINKVAAYNQTWLRCEANGQEKDKESQNDKHIPPGTIRQAHPTQQDADSFPGLAAA